MTELNEQDWKAEIEAIAADRRFGVQLSETQVSQLLFMHEKSVPWINRAAFWKKHYSKGSVSGLKTWTTAAVLENEEKLATDDDKGE